MQGKSVLSSVVEFSIVPMEQGGAQRAGEKVDAVERRLE
jgi:hypothetical protein